ncbi:MAG: glycosyl hydrolase family 92, partial [Marinilabiliales bacterium]
MRKIGLFVLAALMMLACGEVVKKNEKLITYVDPFVGTGGHGHTYPGASAPFGMVQLSPDTRLTGWDGCSAYHYSDSIIYGFSHTHLSGTGVSDYGDVLLMPIKTYEEKAVFGEDYWFKSAFSHDQEKAEPGYYEVRLDNAAVDVKLTASPRCGFHSYTFSGNKAAVVVDLKHRDPVIESGITVVNDSTIQGYRRSRAWAQDQHIYFTAVFNQPIAASMLYKNDTLIGEKTIESKNIKAVFTFDLKESKELLIKLGISAVDAEGSMKNLVAEIPDWDFNKVKEMVQDKWNHELSAIQVEDENEENKKIFYTALYHSLLNPNIFSDVDGRYRGTDLQVHNADGHDHYTIFSLWDTYRATHPLFTLIQQERTNDFINTFLSHYKDGGQLPVCELAGNYTGCMIGYHSVPVIADAYMKGIQDYDMNLALEAMVSSADQQHLGLDSYVKYGYIPADKEHESVSKTLEYAYDDWCIATVAESMGKQELADRFYVRSQFYKNIYDPQTGFIRARKNGAWWEPFDPKEVNFNYTEANSWQYSFYVPQDISGLIELHGGKEKLAIKLDSMFSESNQTTGRHQVDITGLIGQYAHGNDPSHHMAYLYNYVNQPWKTQKMVRRIMKEMYSSKSDGL